MQLLQSRWIQALVGASLVLPLVTMGYLGTLARYVADDYCTASVLMAHGFVGAQQYWYESWNGRFGFVLLIDLLNWLGEWTVPLTPALLVAAFVGAGCAAARQLLPGVSRAWAVLLALLMVSATLAGAPGLWQSLYWQTGSITYLLPLVLTTAAFALGMRVYRAGRLSGAGLAYLALAAVLAMVAVGCSEMSMALLSGALGFASCAVLLLYRRRDRRLLLTILVSMTAAAALASLVLVTAPGNAVRQGLFLTPGPLTAAMYSLWFPCFVVLRLLLQAPAFVVLAYCIPRAASSMIRSETASRPSVRRLVMLGGYVAIAVSGAPAFFSTGGLPPPRALIVPEFGLLATIMACGYLDGVGIRRQSRVPTRQWTRAIAIVVMGVSIGAGPLWTTVQSFGQSGELTAYAASLEAVEAQAGSAATSGESRLLVAPVSEPSMVGLEELGSDATSYPNTCVADYYGLAAISAVSGAESAPA